MQEILQSFAFTYAALFPICNPLGNAAIFLSITSGEKVGLRHVQALKGSLYMLAILVSFYFIGNAILEFFGVSMEAIRIVGGLIVAKIGMQLLSPKKEDTHNAAEESEAQEKEDISFSPLAMPLLAGPGSLAVTISLSALHHDFMSPSMIGAIIGIAAVCGTCWIVLRQADFILRFLGVNGANAMTKIMAFLLLAIGVQLTLTGTGDWLDTILPKH
ncbi:MAG: MarC family NAAT transporter [Chthoniobacterales bacterium]